MFSSLRLVLGLTLETESALLIGFVSTPPITMSHKKRSLEETKVTGYSTERIILRYGSGDAIVHKYAINEKTEIRFIAEFTNKTTMKKQRGDVEAIKKQLGDVKETRSLLVDSNTGRIEVSLFWINLVLLCYLMTQEDKAYMYCVEKGIRKNHKSWSRVIKVTKGKHCNTLEKYVEWLKKEETETQKYTVQGSVY